MKPILPGQAAVARFDGKVCLIVCDEPKFLPVGGVSYGLFGWLHQVAIAGVVVPVVQIVFRLKCADEERPYVAWINELEESVLESLASQPELTLVLVSPKGVAVRDTPMVNALREVAHRSLGIVSALANKPWTPAHFAGARAFIEAGG